MKKAKNDLLSHYNLAIISFTVFTVVALKLSLFSILTTIRWEHWLPAGFKLLCILLLTLEILHEFRKNLLTEKHKINRISYERSYHSVVTAVMMGALVTFFIINELGIAPVVASSLVGLIGAMSSKRYHLPIYCGSFVGMSSMILYGGYQNFLFSAILAGMLFLISGSVFPGSGGKLGIIAFCGTLLYAMATGNAYAVVPLEEITAHHWIFFYLILGAATSWSLHHLTRLNAVESSAVIGLIAGLMLPMLHGTTGSLLASVAFCGSFIGMSSPGRLVSIKHVIGAAGIAALFFIYTQTIFVGLGGKLGVIAFISIYVVNGFEKVRTASISFKTSAVTPSE